jgi:3-phytase
VVSSAAIWAANIEGQMTHIARRCWALGICFSLSISSAFADPAPVKIFTVPAVAETEPAKSLEDAADDAEIWLNPVDPAKSIIFGTDKKSGLQALDLDGSERDFFAVGRVNNVDLRDGWKTAEGAGRVLIGASNRTQKGISFFELDPVTLQTTHNEVSFVATDLSDPYGFCMYRSAATGEVSAIVIGKDGEFRQFVLSATPTGIAAKLVRQFGFGSIAEGCVADDRTGMLYVGDELRGIWRLGAEPNSGDARELIAKVDGVDLVEDIEGVTLAPVGKDGGYLIASVQGNSTFAVFTLPDAKLVARFGIAASADNAVDAVTGTDGIALRLGNFGPKYPGGIFVAQDDVNEGSAQNFKLVSWADVLSKLADGN